MEEYYFLFGLAFLWTIFATIQDLRYREVANWLNFSLITFALAYRAFYSIYTKDIHFFLLGLCGTIIFVGLAYALYYGKAFAGGDAKLLMGYGAILPYSSYVGIFILSLTFLFVLLTAGTIYSLIYSVFIVAKNKNKFNREFKKRLTKNKVLAITILLAFIISIIISLFYSRTILLSVILIFPLVWVYTKSLEVCMIKLYPPEKLTEGDWLEQDVKIGKKTIKKSVHGLSKSEIELIKKYKKKVLIKEGIPFVPAFLIALLIMVFFFVILELSLDSWFLSLF